MTPLKIFNKKLQNPSYKYKGVLEVLDIIKNDKNPLTGFTFSTKDKNFKGGISNRFQIKGNSTMIEKINDLDMKYPEVKKFLSKILNA